jgi:hypothetical protein
VPEENATGTLGAEPLGGLYVVTIALIDDVPQAASATRQTARAATTDRFARMGILRSLTN